MKCILAYHLYCDVVCHQDMISKYFDSWFLDQQLNSEVSSETLTLYHDKNNNENCSIEMYDRFAIGNPARFACYIEQMLLEMKPVGSSNLVLLVNYTVIIQTHIL